MLLKLSKFLEDLSKDIIGSFKNGISKRSQDCALCISCQCSEAFQVGKLLLICEEVSNTIGRSLVIMFHYLQFLVQYQEQGKDSKMVILIICIN